MKLNKFNSKSFTNRTKNFKNTLVSKLAVDALNSEAAFKELRERVRYISERIISKFKNFNDLSDLLSISDMALLKAIKTFKPNKGPFEPHYLAWGQVTVKRELIKGAMIRIPESIINLNSRLSVEDRDLLEEPKNDLKLSMKYKVTIGQIKKVREIKKTTHFPENFDIPESESLYIKKADKLMQPRPIYFAIKKVLKTIPKQFADVIDLKFGISNEEPLALKQLAKQLNIGAEAAKSYLKKGLSLLQDPERKQYISQFL